MSYHIGLKVLRAKIRGFNAVGVTIARRIKNASCYKRNVLWLEKRTLGKHAREHLIAYGLLRGIPYERIERCAKENRPNAAYVFEIIKAHTAFQDTTHLTLEKVKAILQGSAS